MEGLPFSKREPRVRPETTKVKSRKPFDQCVEYSLPQNRQQVTCRPIQTGISREPRLKVLGDKVLDARSTQQERTKASMFYDPYRDGIEPVKLPEPLNISTRHQHVPYDYDTTWISVPDPSTDSSIEAKERFQTSFLKSPLNDIDKAAKAQRLEVLKQRVHTFEDKINEYVGECDKTIRKHDEDTLNGMKKKRVEYLQALELRKQREKIRYFE